MMRRFPIAAAILAASVAFAGGLNAQVLVWSTGNSSDSTQGVADYLTATNLFSSVTAINATTLTLADLDDYKAVLFFTNSSSGSEPSNGNVLADYADLGRTLVLATFSWANQGGNTLAGRIINDSVSPVVLTGSSLYSSVTIGTKDASNFLQGVTSITGYYHDSVAAVSGATTHATWSDGTPLLVTKGNVVAVNLFPVSQNVSGDYQKLFANALFYGVPEPSTYALLALGASLVLWSRRRAANRKDSGP